MEISIIVPVYNAENYLECCLNSILVQSYRDFELILIDDGSTDKSADICDLYARRDGRVRVFHQENKGVSEARDKGVSQARGNYIAFIDADDSVETDYLKTLYTDICRYHTDIACCDYKEMVDGVCTNRNHAVNKNRVVANIDTYVKDYLERKEFYGYAVWGKLIRKDLVQGHTFKKIQYGEDCVYMSEIFEKEPVSVLNAYAGYHYVRHEESATMGGRADVITLQHAFCDEALLRLAKLCNDRSVCVSAAKRYAHTIYESLSVQVKMGNRKAYKDNYSVVRMHIAKVLDVGSIGYKYWVMLHFYKAFPFLYWKMVRAIFVCLGRCGSEFDLG